MKRINESEISYGIEPFRDILERRALALRRRLGAREAKRWQNGEWPTRPDYVYEQAEEWRRISRKILPRTNRGWLTVFPEFEADIPQVIGELRVEYAELELAVTKRLQEIAFSTDDPFSKWFGREVFKANPAMQELVTLRRRIRALRALLPQPALANISRINEEEIERAREYPIPDLLNFPYRKTGKVIVALCPFHQERTPSFTIYPDNSYHCFGCNAHGRNAVDFVMARDHVDFKEAVRGLA